MSRWAAVVLWLHVAAQGLGGGLGFALGPAGVFPDAETDALARLALRLAAWTNLGGAALAATILVRVRDPLVLRGLAGTAASYHLLAGIEALATVAALTDVRTSSPWIGPIHLTHALALLVVIALGVPRSVR